MNIKKIIKEELMKEVGGYDDSTVMASHGGNSLGKLTSVVNELSMMMIGLSTSLNTSNKEDIREFLIEIFGDINDLKQMIKQSISEFTEDELLVNGELILNEISKFQRRSDILIKMFDSMGDDRDIKENVRKMVREFLPKLNNFGEVVNSVNKMFYSRLSGRDKGIFSSRFN